MNWFNLAPSFSFESASFSKLKVITIIYFSSFNSTKDFHINRNIYINLQDLTTQFIQNLKVLIKI